jgi:Holliday junction DNA helicase RuvB
MALTPAQLTELLYSEEFIASKSGAAQEPKRGEDIFEGTDYPREWSGFVGQDDAKEQLQIQIASAKARNARLEHTLFASGTHGIGKSTLAALLAHKAGVGIQETTGPLDVDDARRLIKPMKDGDILFIDEAHNLGRKGEWLLPFMTSGKLYTSSGAIETPNITVVAATTDRGRLPQTILSRFMVQPDLVPYTPDEGARIAANLAGRLGVTLPRGKTAERIAVAADYNPRAMRQILTGVRDLQFARPETHPNLEKAFEWAGVSGDGLTTLAREFLIILLTAKDHTASIESIKAQLGEPGPLKHEEQVLLKRSLITITGRGRQLTDMGRTRAVAELTTLREKAHA